MEFNHIPVLLDSCIKCLHVKEGGIYVDATLGGGGHSSCILERLNNTGTLIGIDRDMEAIKATKERFKKYSNVVYIWDRHENIKEIVKSLGINKVDGIIFDLGVSSYQLDEKTRGFSYTKDAKLDMRMNREDKISAFNVVNEYEEEKLVDIFFKYGEEKYSKRIAREIVRRREIKKIETTKELVDIIEKAVPKISNVGGHPAKRVFQAIRIEVNKELIGLEKVLKDSVEILNDSGILEVITFHSLEDRIVKSTFEKLEGRCTCPKDLPKCVCGYVSYGKIVTKKPIIPNEEEIEGNSRAKSAKLRVFEKIVK